MSQSLKNRKVIFADFAIIKFNQVIQSLSQVEVACESVTEVPLLIEKVTQESYDICVVNLLLAGVGPFELVKNIRSSSRNKDMRILVVTRQVQKVNIQNVIRAGANDFIGEPFESVNLYQRILYHFNKITVVNTEGFEKNESKSDRHPLLTVLLEGIESLSYVERGKINESFHFILNGVAKHMESNRTNIIIVDEPSNSGVVLATSDDPKFSNFPITLDRYPEILHVMRTGSLIFIEDISQNVLTEKIKEQVKSISIGSLMVFPVRFYGDIVGVLNIRTEKIVALPPNEVMRALQSIANTMAAHSNIAVLLRKIYKGYGDKGEKAA